MIYCVGNLLRDKYVHVACSGGIDSIAAAHFIKYKLRKNVRLVHCNHNLREQNGQMADAVLRFAAFFDMGCIVVSPPSPGIQKNNLEHNARQFRLKSFASFDTQIILAHHLDDCIESYFMNFLKGCPEHLPIPIVTSLNRSASTLVRPFMLTKKENFVNYVMMHGLAKFIVHDETNEDTSIRRNWVRKEILPKINERYPGLPKVVKKKMVVAYQELKRANT